MASISSPPLSSPSPYTEPNHHRSFSFRNPKFNLPRKNSPPSKRSSHHLHHQPSRSSKSFICRCQNRSSSSSSDASSDYRWDSSLQEVVKNVIRRFDDVMNAFKSPVVKRDEDLVEEEVVKEKDKDVEDWDWERWKKHFEDVEEQERIVSLLKSQLRDAVYKEDYEDAAKLKVAVAALATNDAVGRVIHYLNRAINDERYKDAAFVRDHAGAGLVGWWAGISKDSDQPYGRIIRISAEHGRFLARSYSPRHLATAAPGVPLFEVFLTMNRKGEYKLQAVYLKRNGGRFGDSTMKPIWSPDIMSNFNSLNKSTTGKSDILTSSPEDMEESEDRDDDSDIAEEMSGFPSILSDKIPAVKVTVLKVTAPGKVDRDLISKVIEQIMDEEEEEDEEQEEEDDDDEEESEEKDFEIETVDISGEDKDDDHDGDVIILDAGVSSDNTVEQSEMAVKAVMGGLVQNMSSTMPSRSILRVPATLKKTDRLSFSFSIDKDDREKADGKGNGLPDKSINLQGQRSIDVIMSDLAKSVVTKEKLPMKVLKDVGELLNLTLNQAKTRQLLSGTTTFNRIEMPSSSDLLNGLYIGSQGLYTSEVIQLRRKFGQWQEDGEEQNLSKLEFYEYVEALKLIGDSYVPAGQVAFRAKIGKQYQLPHKGIIPEEFGVVARYKGQGQLAEPGFKSPRWVDGELLILEGKFFKGEPVVGFVYWAPEYQFLVFFHRLRLQE